MKTILFLFCILILEGCGGLAIKKNIVENYYLIASDDPARTFLSYHEYSDGTFYRGIIDATVFAVGFNDKYIIAKQHSANDTATNFYILPIKKAMDWETKSGLIGPLSSQEFNQKKTELNIPSDLTFSIKLEDLY